MRLDELKLLHISTRLIEEDSFLDRVATYRAECHAVAAHLTGSMSAQEDHIWDVKLVVSDQCVTHAVKIFLTFESVQADRTDSLKECE